MQTLRRVRNEARVNYWCPGCKAVHSIPFGPGGWEWNGEMSLPTFIPSVHVNAPGEDHIPTRPVCHSFVKDGLITYLTDSTHELSGQVVPMQDIGEGYPYERD